MKMTDTLPTTGALQNWTLLVGRVLLALVFVLAGIGKIADFSGTAGYIASVGLPLPSLGVVVAILVEVGAGLALVAGFKARIAALLLAAFAVATSVIFHNDMSDQTNMVMFLKNFAIAGSTRARIQRPRRRLPHRP
jgi:putative oxidoreductase